MRNLSRFWMILVLVTIAISATVWLTSRHVADPVYNGRKLSAWICDLPGAEAKTHGINFAPIKWQPTDSISAHASEAETAVRNIGTNGLPFLMAELEAHDTSREHLAAAWEMIQGYFLRNRRPIQTRFPNKMSSGERRHWHAALALHVLGPAAEPVIPELAAPLKANFGDAEPDAAYALSGVGSAGIAPLMTLVTNASLGMGLDWPKICAIWALGQTPEAGRTVVPQLLAVLQDKKDPLVRRAAVWTLSQLDTNEELIVPALASQLSDTFGKRMAEQALRKYGISQFKPAALKDYMTNSKPCIRMAATNAYITLYPDDAAKLGLK